jgi:acetylornithine deacetylase/succinyl-diaminopimelate desuccinylase-like protein
MIATFPETQRLIQSVNRQRLLDTAIRLIAVPSRTGEAGAVADCLADLLTADGFQVERPTGGHPRAPAVIVRWNTGRPGRMLQFNGHLDTVHLPFVPPAVEGDRLTGSGSADMKAGVAAAVEALRVLRDTDMLPGGGILFSANDLHEAPWGNGGQLNQLIAEGYVGDAVLIPEYLNHCVPIIGRGAMTWKVLLRRPGAPVHEVMRPLHEASVIAAGAELVRRLEHLNGQVSQQSDPLAGPESVFIGQIHSGEIYNQYPQECLVEGTRRWLPDTTRAEVESQFRALLDGVAAETGTTATATLFWIRDAFRLDVNDPLVAAFQQAHQTLSGNPLPLGAKAFCDDGNSFWALGKVAAITHGPRAGGAHTLQEWVSVDDLVRVAAVYALAAVQYCGTAA